MWVRTLSPGPNWSGFLVPIAKRTMAELRALEPIQLTNLVDFERFRKSNNPQARISGVFGEAFRNTLEISHQNLMTMVDI